MAAYCIAICEDDKEAAEDLAARCKAIFDAWQVETAVECFASADALLACLVADFSRFDLFLLDIQMQGTNGLDLAQWLYDNGVHDRVIFITGHAEYALAGYNAHPLHYLLKPVENAALAETLNLAWSLHGPQSLILQRGRKMVALPLAEIRYVESQGHHINVHLGTESRLFTFTMQEIEKLLPRARFARCHKSYLVNLDWVAEVDKISVHLRDGERLPLSRSFYLDFQTAFVSYLNRSNIE